MHTVFPVRRLPSAPENPALHFDRHTYIKPKKAVSVTKTRNGFESTGIDFADYTGMGIRKPVQLVSGKHKPAPEWATDDSKLRELIVLYLENRTRLRPVEGHTLQERLAHAMKVLETHRPNLSAVLTKLTKEYVTTRDTEPGNKRKLRRLSLQIMNLDTQLMILSKSAAVVTSIVYLSWRANMNSVGVAEQLGIKPPHIRTVLHRLGNLWKRHQNPNFKPQYSKLLPWVVMGRGCRLGRLTILHPYEPEPIPVEVICKLEPRSLVTYKRRAGRVIEGWVDNCYLVHGAWRKATMSPEALQFAPSFSSWVCQCDCGSKVTISTYRLRMYRVKSCDRCAATAP